MTSSTGNRFRRSDLAHGSDHLLVPSATFRDEAGSSFTARFATDAALGAFLDLALHYPGTTSTVRMFLKPKGYTPPESAAPEWLPSCLFFDVDQERGVAAAALLIFDARGVSHQWLSQGELGRDDVVLVMDEFNPEFAQFPQDSFVPVVDLRNAAIQWAFGDDLPPSAVAWRPASEHEVGWPVGASY